MSLIPKSEFEERVEKIREVMDKENIDIFLVYGDEYRRENLRYLSDYWPIFERAMVAFGKKGAPVLLVGPEGERYANEASVWSDIRVIKEMEMSYIPDQIDYSLTRYSSLKDVINDLGNGEKLNKVGVCGIDAMSVLTYRAIKKAIGDAQLVDADKIVYKLRLLKSDNEVAALKKAAEVCDIGYKAVLDADIVGLTEIEAAAIGEKAARDAGAEDIVFSIFASGEGRTNTVVGRPTNKVIQAGDIIMYALAVQYDGYIATDEWPFVAGNQSTPSQKKLIDSLIIAEDIGIQIIKPGVPAGEVVHRIREYFKENGFQENYLYPPIHGIGLAEAESPYPDENSTYSFEPRMGINFDVSLFGVKGVGSNRIEEGFIVGENGLINLSPLITELRTTYLEGLKIKG
jgi:Xaa-Pro aminopeptidase